MVTLLAALLWCVRLTAFQTECAEIVSTVLINIALRLHMPCLLYASIIVLSEGEFAITDSGCAHLIARSACRAQSWEDSAKYGLSSMCNCLRLPMPKGRSNQDWTAGPSCLVLYTCDMDTFYVPL